MVPEREFSGDMAAGLFAKINPEGTVEFAVIGVIEKELLDDLRSRQSEPSFEDMDIKLPAGCADTPEETPEEALLRETRQECFQGQCVLGPILLVHERRMKNKDPKALSAEHVQRFFLITRWEGEFRKNDIIEDEGDEYLTPPMMVEFAKLVPLIFGTHMNALFKAVGELAKKNPHIADQYTDLLEDFEAGKIRPTYRRRTRT